MSKGHLTESLKSLINREVLLLFDRVRNGSHGLSQFVKDYTKCIII